MARPAGPAGSIPIGARFNRLEVAGHWSKDKRGAFVYPVRCDCGKEFTAIGYNLISGNSQSCGCRIKEASGDAHRTHGETGTRLYRMWADLRNRCNNPKNQRYADYGGRGIRCEADWDTYEAFRDWAIGQGYLPIHTVERKDVNGNYGPDNCGLIPKGMQSQNHRKRKTHHGKELTSSYHGVCLERSKNLWVAQINCGLTRVHLGRYKSEHHAAYAYNVAASTLFVEWSEKNTIPPGAVSLKDKQRIEEATARRIALKTEVA